VPVISPAKFRTEDTSPAHDDSEIKAGLGHLLEEARKSGLPDSVSLRVIMNWAAEQAYENGGYGVAKALSLNALEEILFRASR
jgi:hypothetical protein